MTTPRKSKDPDVLSPMQKHTGEPPMIGEWEKVQTIYVDGLKGLQLRQGAVKLAFVEHIMDQSTDTLHARQVVNLVLTFGSLKVMVRTLQRMIDEAPTEVTTP